MQNKLLIVYTTIGPTFRERSVINIVDNLNSYSFFDILLLTDYVNDPIYDQIKHLDNVIIKDIDGMRKEYAWSIEHERLPVKTLSDEEYATHLVVNNMALPSPLWRFALLLENIEQYDCVLFCNCDIVFTGGQEEFQLLSNAVKNITETTVFGHGGYIITDQFKNEFDWLCNRSNFERKKEYLWCSDGNLFCYCFKNKDDIKIFFDTMNTIIYNVMVDAVSETFFLGRHGMWLLNNEPIQSIAYAVTDIKIGADACLHELYRMVTLMRYPEDRFWNWCAWLPEQEMVSTLKGKKHFIETNYELLKKYYEHFGQPWKY